MLNRREMDMQPRIVVVTAVCAAYALAAPLRAQSAAASTVSSCSYAECALRFEPGGWNQRLVRGASGHTVGKLGPFTSSAIDSLLAGPDSAAANARRYVIENRKSSTYWLIAAAATVFAAIHSKGRDPHAVDWAALGVGFLTFGSSGRHAENAAASLSRSVWWYNSTFPR